MYGLTAIAQDNAMRLASAIAGFETALRADSRSPHTLGSYLHDLGLLATSLAEQARADPDVHDLTPTDLAAFVASGPVQLKRDGSPKAPGSVNTVRASLRSFFGWLVETGELGQSPARTLKLRRADAAPPELLTPAEQKRLLKTIRARKGEAAARDRLVTELLLGSGIRLSSLVGLDVEDLRLDDKRMIITAKGGRREAVFVKSDLRKLLRDHVRGLAKKGEDTGPLLRSGHGTRISGRQVQVRLRYWLDEAGIDKAVSPHSLRHTFGTALYAKSRDLRLVQRALGHRHVATTQIYVSLCDDALEEAVEGM